MCMRHLRVTAKAVTGDVSQTHCRSDGHALAAPADFDWTTSGAETGAAGGPDGGGGHCVERVGGNPR